jgi:hypothetical protein
MQKWTQSYSAAALPQFALPAGYGEIMVALTAPSVVFALGRNKPCPAN